MAKGKIGISIREPGQVRFIGTEDSSPVSIAVGGNDFSINKSPKNNIFSCLLISVMGVILICIYQLVLIFSVLKS